MSCCLSSNLLINHFMEKKSSLNGWLRRRFNQSQTSKLSDKEIIQLEESKYIKKIGCSVSKHSIDHNFRSDYFSVTKESRQNDKDIIRLPNALAANGLQQKSSNHRISNGSLNNDEWEIFFVLDETKANRESNEDEGQPADKKKKNEATDRPAKVGAEKKHQDESAKSTNEDARSELDHLELDELEWDDDFINDDALAYDEEEHLIFERPR